MWLSASIVRSALLHRSHLTLAYEQVIYKLQKYNSGRRCNKDDIFYILKDEMAGMLGGIPMLVSSLRTPDPVQSVKSHLVLLNDV